MEKICEFCTALRPVVYCKADGAYLCLSCDAKVHSANALSHRHLRTLLCDSCRYQPAYARCLDLRMFVCRTCDKNQHYIASQHRKRVVSSYIGCPSAKDFAALWGFELDKFDKGDVQEQLLASHTSGKLGEANFATSKELLLQNGACSTTSNASSSTLHSGEFSLGSSSQQNKMLYNGQQQQNTCFILQQILDLKRLQLTEMNSSSSVMGKREQMEISSSILNSFEKLNDKFDQMQHLQNFVADISENDCQLQELNPDSLPLPFTQPENMPLCSTATSALLGESFWDCKSPNLNSQLWSQNMQDLGTCEDIFHDDFNIPDVDISFCNFEELFGADKDPMRELTDDKDVSCSSVDKDMSVDKSDNHSAGVREEKSMASCLHINPRVQTESDKGPSPQAYNFSADVDTHQPLRASYSAMSFSISRLSAESSNTECLDSGFPSRASGAEQSCLLPDPDGEHTRAKEIAMTSYREKKKSRLQEKQIRYGPVKARSDVRKRVKSRLAKMTEGYESDTFDVTRSY